jgi:hypothetical protein
MPGRRAVGCARRRARPVTCFAHSPAYWSRRSGEEVSERFA